MTGLTQPCQDTWFALWPTSEFVVALPRKSVGEKKAQCRGALEGSAVCKIACGNEPRYEFDFSASTPMPVKPRGEAAIF